MEVVRTRVFDDICTYSFKGIFEVGILEELVGPRGVIDNLRFTCELPVRNDGDDGDGDAEGVVSRANAKNHAKMASLIPSFSQLSLKSYTQNPNPDDDDEYDGDDDDDDDDGDDDDNIDDFDGRWRWRQGWRRGERWGWQANGDGN